VEAASESAGVRALIRGRAAVVAFVALALASGGYVVRGFVSAREVAAASAGRPARLTTPVVSARRVPRLLASTVAEIRLGVDLDSLLDDPGLGAARASSCLAVEDGSRAVYRHAADQRLVPASTMKVVTGTAALRRMGDGFRFITEVRADAPAVGGVIEGPLYLVGAGDPLLETAAYAATFRNQPQVYTSMDDLADRIAATGVREIRGGVRGDESRFDQSRYLDSWKAAYRTDNEIGPVSALVVNDNFSQFRPTKAIAAADPAANAAAVLTELLRGRGLVVGDPGAGTAPTEGAPLAFVSSPPLPEIVGEMLRESDNMTAEVLTKELGRRFGSDGTWAEGVKVIASTVREAGLPVAGYAAVDGSGLDVSDRLSCSLLMDALDLAGPKSALASGLAVAGQTGTLATRFKGNPAAGRRRAKTGSLNNVTGLVGFVDAADDRTLEFALLANDLRDKSESGRVLQERVGAALVRYPDAPPPAQLAPLAAALRGVR